MRGALFATAGMNIGGAALFAPPARALRAIAGFPPGEHPLYLATVTMFVLLFGLGYLWAAAAGRAERLFITIAAVGKLSFFALRSEEHTSELQSLAYLVCRLLLEKKK